MTSDDVMEVIRQHPGATSGVVAEALREKSKDAAAMLHHLFVKNLVQREGKGRSDEPFRYTIAPESAQSAAPRKRRRRRSSFKDAAAHTLLMIERRDKETIVLDFEEAAAVYRQLKGIFK